MAMAVLVQRGCEGGSGGGVKLPIVTIPRPAAPIWAAAACWLVFAFSGLLHAQQAPRTAMAYFPADTQQIAYCSFVQLRTLSDYPEIRDHVLRQQFRAFQDFLSSAGIDPEKDVDEVMVGWHGESLGGPANFGVAVGRFDPDKVSDFYTKSQLPVQQYLGSDLMAFGSGFDPADTFFTFLDSTSAAFGQLHDLKILLDVRDGSATALDTNQDFRSYEAELEGTSPQWGILTGKAAANAAAPWLSGGGKGSLDLTVFLQPVIAVLYRVDWNSGFTAHISLVCKDPGSAEGLLRLLNLLKSAPPLPASASNPGTDSILRNLDVHQDGSRLEMNVSGPADALDQVLKTGG